MSWDSDPPSGAPSATGGNHPHPELSAAPVHWLYLGIGSALIGLVLPLVTSDTLLAVVGWLLGGTVSIVLLGVFISSDSRRRAAGWVRSGEATSWLRAALLLVAAVAVVVNAWVIADAVARHQW